MIRRQKIDATADASLESPEAQSGDNGELRPVEPFVSPPPRLSACFTAPLTVRLSACAKKSQAFAFKAVFLPPLLVAQILHPLECK